MTSDLLAGAHSIHSRKLSAALRRSAYEAGWPVSAARHLWVTHEEDGEYGVRYPGHVADHVEAHEYGEGDRPGLPVIRQFMNRLDHHDHHLDSALHEFVHGLELMD